jgi:hypothetical protein
MAMWFAGATIHRVMRRWNAPLGMVNRRPGTALCQGYGGRAGNSCPDGHDLALSAVMSRLDSIDDLCLFDALARVCSLSAAA